MNVSTYSPEVYIIHVQGVPSASSQLAVSVLQTCCQKLEPFVRGFLTSCIMDRDAEGSELRENYHKIIYKIFTCTPQMLFDVIPNLTQELLVLASFGELYILESIYIF